MLAINLESQASNSVLTGLNTGKNIQAPKLYEIQKIDQTMSRVDQMEIKVEATS